MSYRTRRLVRRLPATLLIAVVIALVLCEVGLRIVVASVPSGLGVSPGMVTERSVRLPQYAHSPYWSPEFAAAWIDTAHGHFNEDGVPVDNDAMLPGYTIIHSQRLTTDTPANYTRTIWMYGSSTVWGAYVADGWTIPSYLQREANARRIPLRVVNAAQSNITIDMQNYWLNHSDVKSGDIVIYLDGAFDVKQTIDYAEKDWLSSILPCKISTKVPLLIAALWCQSSTSGGIPASYIANRAETDIPHYWNQMAIAKHYAELHDATFYHFFQPTTYPHSDLYTVYRRGATPIAIDTSDYFDSFHYDDAAHAAIARQIAAALWLTF